MKICHLPLIRARHAVGSSSPLVDLSSPIWSFCDFGASCVGKANIWCVWMGATCARHFPTESTWSSRGRQGFGLWCLVPTRLALRQGSAGQVGCPWWRPCTSQTSRPSRSSRGRWQPDHKPATHSPHCPHLPSLTGSAVDERSWPFTSDLRYELGLAGSTLPARDRQTNRERPRRKEGNLS